MPTLIKAKGLGTYHNELGLPEGSLLAADNIVIDRNDVINPRRGLSRYGTPVAACGSYCQLLTYKKRILAHDGAKLYFDCCCTSGCFTQFAGCYAPLESGLRIKAVESNSNLYFTTTDGIMKISGTSTPCACCSCVLVTNFSTDADYIVKAGGPKALDTTGVVSYSCGAFLPPLSKTAYRIIWGTKDNNKNLILGSPSSRFLISNTDEDKYVREINCITVNAACHACLTAGSYFLLADGCGANYFVWYSDACTPVAPATSETINKTGILVEHGACDTAAQIAAKSASAISVHCVVFCVSSTCAVLNITNKTGGDVTNVADGACATGFSFTCAPFIGGSTCLGVAANVCLTFSVPSDITTTCYFYQVYRSRVITTCSLCCVPCLEPGDEMNLVIENSVTTCDLTAGTITVQDTTSDCFRESGVLAYTNPTSGQGILQANEKPPISKDVELFRNTVFYSNTQTIQRKQFNLLSAVIKDCCATPPVTGFTSGVSKFIIGNECKAREYTFVGAKETTSIVVPAQPCAVPFEDENVNICLDQFTIVGHPFVDGDRVTLSVSIGCAVAVPCTCTNPGSCNFSIANNFITNERVQLTTTGSLPTGLALCTNYYIHGSTGSCSVRLALSRGACWKTFSTAGTGIHTITPTGTIHCGLNVCCTYYANNVDANRIRLHTTYCGAICNTCSVDVTALQSPGSVCIHLDVINESYFLLNSPSNEKKYFFWFAAWCGTVPCAADTSGRIPIAVSYNRGESACCTAFSLFTKINAQSDFCAVIGVCCNEVIVNTLKNGNVDDVVDGSDRPTKFTFCVTTQGGGGVADTCAGGDILLSSLSSIGQSIDETARSLVNIINRDTCGIANAFYLSGEDDLPGIILLEGRNLSDDEFYIGVNDTCITNKFNPVMPLAKSITGTAGACACTKTTVTSAAHGFVNNDEVYIYNTVCCTALLGKYTVSGKTCCTFVVNQAFVATTVGEVFDADEVSDNEDKPNRLYYSKKNIPEAVPLVNFLDVGRQDSAIRRIVALRDSLFILKDNGVFILTGDNGVFDVRELGSSTNIVAPDSAAVLNNQIYMLTTQGVTTVSDTGIGVISYPIEDKILDVVTGPCFCTENAAFGVGYESERSYILWVPEVSTDTVSTQAYRYNTFNKSWVRWTIPAKAGLVNPVDDKLYIAAGDSSYIRKERKDGDRSDYADDQFCICIAIQVICSCIERIELSSLDDVCAGDVIVQSQYLTIAKFNRLLRKLDLDSGMDNDYFSTQELTSGVCSGQALVDLVAKICADDVSICYTAPTAAPSTFSQMRLDHNVLVGELINCSTDAAINTYQTIGACCIVEQEVIITGTCATRKTACLGFIMPILAGAAVHYKGISVVVEYAPQHFGDPSVVKQISEGSIVFDGNNFFKANIGYSTDLSKDVTCFEFSGRGPGFYGGFDNGCTAFGGEGSDVPYRHLIPRNKQRCRYITAKFKHSVAREDFSVVGIGFSMRPLSTRGYRDT